MNLSIINTVLTVSRCKSFMEASYALNYTPAVVSKHIARAEEELGVRLFLRGNKANSITRTPECEAVIGDLEQIMSSWERVETTLELLRTDARKSTVRIGTPRRAWNYGSDEIIAGFYRHSPELSVDMTYAHTEELLRLLSLGKLDGVFLFVQGKAGDYEFLERFRREQECEFFFIEEIRQMYLAISDRLPLARKDEASFAEFRDFTIAFNSDRLAISAGRNMIPFLNLAAKYGFPLRHKALPTLDASVYRLAKDSDLAIPVPDSSFRYEGIKYVRLTDWTEGISCYFVTMRRNDSPALARFNAEVRAFAARRACPEGPQDKN